MAFDENERQSYQRIMESWLVEKRPPEHIRDKLDIGFRITGQSIEIFEIRPMFSDPGSKHEIPVAKTTFVRTQGVWKIYWQMRDLKWHSYEPKAEAQTLEEFLKTVDEDAYCAFWG